MVAIDSLPFINCLFYKVCKQLHLRAHWDGEVLGHRTSPKFAGNTSDETQIFDHNYVWCPLGCYKKFMFRWQVGRGWSRQGRRTPCSTARSSPTPWWANSLACAPRPKTRVRQARLDPGEDPCPWSALPGGSITISQGWNTPRTPSIQSSAPAPPLTRCPTAQVVTLSVPWPLMDMAVQWPARKSRPQTTS